DSDLGKLGYNYRKLEEAAKDAGVEVPTETVGISEERLTEILRVDREEQAKVFDKQKDELIKVVSNKNNAASLGGGGNKPPVSQHPMPDDPDVKRLLTQGYKWDSQAGLLITPSGKKVDLNDRSDIGQL
ncbi:unnamed protein product, partial [marine sediment metagenome]